LKAEVAMNEYRNKYQEWDFDFEKLDLKLIG